MLLPIHHNADNIRVPPQIGICSYLENFGHKVDWIIWSGKPCPLQEFLFDNIRVHVIPEANYFPIFSLSGKMLNMIPNFLKRGHSIIKIFKKENYNVIFVRDNPFDGLIAAYIKRKYHISFIFELSNPLEQEWECLNMLPKNMKWILLYCAANFKRLTSSYLLHEADLILPTTKWFKESLIEKGIPETKIMAYPNGVSIRAYQDKSRLDIRGKYCLIDSKIIIYVGTLGKARKLEILIQAFSIVKKAKNNVMLLIVGQGDDENNLKKMAKELKIDRYVIFVGQVSQSIVPDFIDEADIGISPVPPLSFYKMSSPIKMFEYMGMGKPVIANEEIPEHKEVLKQSKGGILVPFVPDAFADAMIDLLDNPDKAFQTGQRGKEWVLKNRTYEILARQLEQKLFEIVKIS